ncbi:CFEM domain-containing protein [Tolypocladium capitatum]|uniref:CFEM domain-containing protein n=1 Tax=Tolypocladium capitatum TaxID=45235 RepID=A0A2K3QR55_9HYPO|nr:CFEM domain-containing protein [Tolypocladium capitatum]
MTTAGNRWTPAKHHPSSRPTPLLPTETKPNTVSSPPTPPPPSMQFKAAAIALFAVAATTQELSGLPDCAKPCFDDNFPSSGCKEKKDYICLCRSEPYNEAVTNCVAKSNCKVGEILRARQWATDKCKAVGKPI